MKLKIKGMMFFLLVVLSFAPSAFSNVLEIKNVLDKDNFFASTGETIILNSDYIDLKKVGNLNTDISERVRKIPVKFLSDLGIQENMEIQSFDYTRNELIKYKVKKEVNILLSRRSSLRESSSPPWSLVNLILSDDPGVHKNLTKLDNLPVHGFAYLGKTRILKRNPQIRLQFKSMSKDDISFSLLTKSYGTSTLTALESNVGAVRIIKIHGPSNLNAYLFDDYKGKMREISNGSKQNPTGKWLNGYIVMIQPDDREGYNCTTLYLLSRTNIEKSELPCTSY